MQTLLVKGTIVFKFKNRICYALESFLEIKHYKSSTLWTSCTLWKKTCKLIGNVIGKYNSSLSETVVHWTPEVRRKQVGPIVAWQDNGWWKVKKPGPAMGRSIMEASWTEILSLDFCTGRRENMEFVYCFVLHHVTHKKERSLLKFYSKKFCPQKWHTF